MLVYTTLKFLYGNFTISDGFSEDHHLFGNEKTTKFQCARVPLCPSFPYITGTIIGETMQQTHIFGQNLIGLDMAVCIQPKSYNNRDCIRNPWQPEF